MTISSSITKYRFCVGDIILITAYYSDQLFKIISIANSEYIYHMSHVTHI